MSWTGMVIMYANYPIYWHSSLQTKNLSKYFRSRVHCIIICFTIAVTADDYDGRNQKNISSPHTKSQVCMSSPWKQSVLYKNGYRETHFPANWTHHIKIPPLQIQCKIWTSGLTYTPTDEQLADIITKPFSNKEFFTLQYMLCGWGCTSKQS